jgi:hypothetical protein
MTAVPDLRQPDGNNAAAIRQRYSACPKTSRETKKLAAKKSQAAAASREQHLNSGILADFDDNVIARLRR